MGRPEIGGTDVEVRQPDVESSPDPADAESSPPFRRTHRRAKWNHRTITIRAAARVCSVEGGGGDACVG
jgi:hypothetical protein